MNMHQLELGNIRQYQEETGRSVSGLDERSDAKIQRTEKQMSEEIVVNRPSWSDLPQALLCKSATRAGFKIRFKLGSLITR